MEMQEERSGIWLKTERDLMGFSFVMQDNFIKNLIWCCCLDIDVDITVE